MFWESAVPTAVLAVCALTTRQVWQNLHCLVNSSANDFAQCIQKIVASVAHMITHCGEQSRQDRIEEEEAEDGGAADLSQCLVM